MSAEEVKEKAEAIPDWLKQMVDAPNAFREAHQKANPYVIVDNIDNKIKRFIKPSSISKTRTEQLNLMQETFELLQQSDLPPREKTRIARGLMLAMKYQIEREGGFKSRLGTVLDTYLNKTDGTMDPLEADECLQAFKAFSTRLQCSKQMTEKIQEAVDNKNWQAEQFYSLHQKIDAIQEAGKTVSILDLSTPGKFKEIYIQLNQGVEGGVNLPLRQSRVRNHERMSYQRGAVGAIPAGPSLPSFEAMINEAINNIRKMHITAPPSLENLKKIAEALEDYKYLIKIGEEQFSKINPIDKKFLQELLNSLNTPLEDLRVAYIAAVKDPLLLKTQVANPVLPTTPTSIIGIEPKPKQGLHLFAHARFQNNNALKQKTQSDIHQLRMNINNMSPPINSKGASDPDIKAALENAQNRREGMQKSSMKNVSATSLSKEVSDLMKRLNENLLMLEGYLTNPEPNPERQQARIDIYMKNMECRLETLANLAKMAEMKLDPAANMIRHRVNPEEAKKLQEAFKQNPIDLNKFNDLRKQVLQPKAAPSV